MVVTKTIPVLNIGKLSNAGWTILACSSEEPEEGGIESPLGYATAMIDGDLSTFWHSRWKDPVPGYPALGGSRHGYGAYHQQLRLLQTSGR